MQINSFDKNKYENIDKMAAESELALNLNSLQK